MRGLLKVLCFLSVVSCAPSRNNSDNSIAATELTTKKLDSCTLQTRISNEIKGLPTETSANETSDVDPTYENYIVKYKDHANNLEARGSAKREFGVSGLKLHSISGSLYNLRLTGSTLEKLQILTRLSQQSNVDFVEPDYPIKSNPITPTQEIPDDPYFSKQWF